MPRNVHVLGFLFFFKGEDGTHHKTTEKYYTNVTYQITAIWKKTGIHIITYNATRKKLHALVELYAKTKRNIHKQSAHVPGDFFF